jgi:hypothetical protein
MASVGELLDNIKQNIQKTKLSQAQQQLNSLIIDLGPTGAETWLPDIEATIALFFKKRRKELNATLEGVRQKDRTGKQQTDNSAEATARDLEQFLSHLQDDLDELSKLHIFQWPTYYRDWVGVTIDKLIDMPVTTGQKALDAFQEQILNHSTHIFEKGFKFKVHEQKRAEEAAHATALSGVQRFADLAIEHYSGGAIKESKGSRRVALRKVTSSMLTGILSGFIKCQSHSKTGAQLLASSRVRWFHYLTFIDASGISRLATEMGEGSISATLRRFIRPLACALDKCVLMETAYAPLPQLSQYFHEKRRLEVLAISSGAARGSCKAEVFALLDAETPPLADLREAESREISLVICGLKPDVARSPQAERIQGSIVDTNEGNQSSSQFEQRACAILSGTFSKPSQEHGDAVLEHNFARTFPLNNPFQSRYFHVVRKSVRNLLQEIEGRNGVRLWCSARRSGKTTACNDLSGSLASSETVFQTCEVLKEDDVSGRLYGVLLQHLDLGTPISRTFSIDIIEEVRQGSIPTGRIVLVIDEYETLFGRLQGAVNYNADLKYTIAFPLLDQLVAFAKENMVVLVGQQPNAHYVFMDQNKLSAYVAQDSFPLFNHQPKSTTGEFVDLLAKVLSERFGFTAGFADGLFEETRGHPYLTVNMIVSMVEWLIRTRTKVAKVRFDSGLLGNYFADELTPEKISLNTEYQFFLEAAADAMSEQGRRSNPWLWSIYRAMRMFVREFGAQGQCTTGDFIDRYGKLGLDRQGVAALDLLRTGDDANFFKVDVRSYVRVGIPVLARISAAATPRTN